MALLKNAISIAAETLRGTLADNIFEIETSSIAIGHPKQLAVRADESKNWLNLFFYHLTYDGYPADGTNEQPLYVRLHCLITPFGEQNTNDGISTGENDLRLIGAVMDVLHQHSTLEIKDNSNSEVVAMLEVVPHPLGLDDLNHIWSTQGDIPYRLSIAFELALAPIPLKQLVDLTSSEVKSVSVEAKGSLLWKNK